jgi:hypothetical protein
MGGWRSGVMDNCLFDGQMLQRSSMLHRSSIRSRFVPWQERCHAVTTALLAIATLSCVACATKRSPPPAPSREASSEERTLQPAAKASTPEVRAPAQSSVSASNPTNARPTAADWKRDLNTLPDSVLVGTDVTPLSEFLGSVTSIPSSGAFRSEQGGATAQVRLETGPQGQTLTREFSEPGTSAQIKRYEALRAQADGMRLSGSDLEVLGVAQGILVLEKRSGVEGIPDSLWIQYDLTPDKASAKGDEH